MPQHRPIAPADQSTAHPTLDTFAAALEQATTETFEQCRTDSAAQRETFDLAVAALVESLTKSRTQLSCSFTLMRQKKVEAIGETTERLKTELDAQRSWLLKKVRPVFEQQLKSQAPDKNPVLGLLEKINESARQAIDALPDDQPPLEPASEPAGKSLRQRLTKGIHDLSGRGRQGQLTPRDRAFRILPTSEALQQHPLVTKHAELVAQLESKTADLWSSLRFHFQVASEELDRLRAEPGDETIPDLHAALSEAEQLALGVLDAAAETFTVEAQPLKEFWGSLCDRLQQHETGVCQSLCEALSGQEVTQAEPWHALGKILRHQREMLKHRVLDYQESEGPMSLASFTKAVLGGLQEVIQTEPGQQEKLLGLADLPSTAEILQRTDGFPHLYRRLFTLGPLKNREFLVAREEELKTLDGLYKRWEKGKACSLAVIGPEGSGKTSLANCFASEYGVRGNLMRVEIKQRLRSEQDVIELFRQWFTIAAPTDSLDTLVQQLLAQPRRMLLVEAGHNLALRVVDGRRCAEVFFYLLLATRRHFLWLVTFRKIPWTQMDYQFGISRFFTHQISTLLANQREIRQALMLRQRISGYPLDFLSEAGEKTEMAPEDRNKREDRFFRELFAASGGNLDAALYYWLLCLDYRPESKRFVACHLGKIDFSFLRSLDRDQLFTLAEVLGHGGLTAKEHSEIFHCDRLHSRLQLDFLSSLGLLLTPENADSPYRLNPVYYTPVTSTLESLHLLY